jgi:DNA-binding GntR family transcriptional regulator
VAPAAQGRRARVRPPAGTRRYQAIAERLLADIRNGRHPVGSRLPTEVELCRRFRASRYTVREALRAITERGLISRRPGAGSLVVAAEQPPVFTQRLASLAGLLSYPAGTYRENVAAGEIVADARLAALLRCAPGARWFRISAVRRSDALDVPLCWADIYVLPRYADVVKSPRHERTSVYEQIERLHGEIIDRAQLEIFASRVPRAIARVLKVRADSPALTVVRRYTGLSGEVFETTVTVHPEHRYTYSMELNRELRTAR